MIIKAGTYRFNDVYTLPGDTLEQCIEFSFSTFSPDYGISVFFICDTIKVGLGNGGMSYRAVYAEPDISSFGFVLPYWSKVCGLTFWNTGDLGEGIKTITIPYDQEASDEYGTWFYANVKEQKQISGKWRWNDVLTSPSENIRQDIGFVCTSVLPLNGETYVFEGDYMDVQYSNILYRCVSSNPAPPSALNISFPWLFYAYSANAWNVSSYGEGIKTTDYGTTPQWVSADYYDYVIANAKPVTEEPEQKPVASIHYNGSTIASLFGGQTATVKLKGDGVQVIPDIVVEVAENVGGGSGGGDANIVPLIVGEPGVYDANSHVIVTETFTGGGTPDAVLNYFGTSLPYFKAKKLVATRDIIPLANNESLANTLYGNLFGDVVPLYATNKYTEYFGNDGSLVILLSGVPAIIWVFSTDDSFLTEDAGFEAGCVYIFDAWNLMGAEGEASLTALGVPDKPADGFMPVTVGMPAEELVVTPDASEQTFGVDTWYKSVTVEAVPSRNVTIYPSTQDITVSRTTDDLGNRVTDRTKWKWIDYITVKAADVSKMEHLGGVYINTFPKTEYAQGESFETTGGILKLQYTNGGFAYVDMSTQYCHVPDDFRNGVPGKYTITVQYSESGVTVYTTYQITRAAE